MGPVIQARELERQFGARTVLAGVDLAVAPGEIHGVLGPAGAGKTLLLRVLAGQLPPSGGQIGVRGRVELVRAEDRKEFACISAFENLVFAGRMHGLAPLECVERARKLLREAGLAGACDLPVGTFTPALLERLALARALMSAPAVLLVDENGADTPTVRNLVRLHALRGGAAVWATRRLDSLRGLARDVTLLAGGRVRYAGSVDALALRALPGSVAAFPQALAA